MPQPVAVVANPAAGRGRGPAPGAAVVRQLSAAGHRVTDLTSRTWAEGRDRAAAAVASGVQALVVVGGDGMVHLGAGVCAGTEVPLGIVATGTGNDVARGLGLPVADLDRSVHVVLRALGNEDGGRRRIDVVEVTSPLGTARYVAVLSAGFDAVVNERANGWVWPRGRLRYYLAIARELPVFRPLRYRLVLDGAVEEVSAMLVAVANGPSFGGGLRIAPSAELDDGLLDVCLLHPVSTLGLLRLLPRVLGGTHVDHPRVSLRQARSVQIETLDVRVVAYADGERVAPLPVGCRVVPGALMVLAPPP